VLSDPLVGEVAKIMEHEFTTYRGKQNEDGKRNIDLSYRSPGDVYNISAEFENSPCLGQRDKGNSHVISEFKAQTQEQSTKREYMYAKPQKLSGITFNDNFGLNPFGDISDLMVDFD
jgi:hypothetical protein